MEIFAVEGPWPGRLAVITRPRAGHFLADDLRRLRREGFDVLVSALTPGEAARLWLEDAESACRQQGIEFLSYPIGNLQTPAPDGALSTWPVWCDRLRAGEGFAIHCWGGIGRSPLIAASLLALSGVAPAEAWRRVEAARGCQVPDTYEQRDWVAALVRRRESEA
jgi:hypothetical protein